MEGGCWELSTASFEVVAWAYAVDITLMVAGPLLVWHLLQLSAGSCAYADLDAWLSNAEMFGFADCRSYQAACLLACLLLGVLQHFKMKAQLRSMRSTNRYGLTFI